MKSILLTISILIPAILIGQKTTKINKYSIGLEINVGHSFPNFDKEQEQWKGTFYPAGGINVLFVNRINQKWITDLGVGITGYALTNQGSVDNYVLDFASPTISSGVSYNFLNRHGQENFIKLTSGFQLGYRGTFIDEFEDYTVRIEGNHKLYQFIRPEIGIRRYFKQRMKGSRYKMAYEFGTYFRYNLNILGTATIEENDFEVTLKPRGNIIGGYFKILFPAGKKRIRLKPQKEKELPPIIYNPRYLK
ncbi:MAG: hypothetical protein H6577_21885 [Lewinellaceae bacterium]|nr:hypothetical protein [Lewinellaceae bacterium]